MQKIIRLSNADSRVSFGGGPGRDDGDIWDELSSGAAAVSASTGAISRGAVFLGPAGAAASATFGTVSVVTGAVAIGADVVDRYVGGERL